MNIKVEAEHNELILENNFGDKVIIPANKREWVLSKLKNKCYSCIDEFVSTLPTDKDYAEDGSLYKDYLNNPEEPLKGGDLPTVEVTEKAPDWVKYRKEYVKNNPFNIEEYVENRLKFPINNEKIEAINEDELRQKLRQEGLLKRYNEAMDYISNRLVEEKPIGNLSRAEWLNTLTKKEEELVKRNPKFRPTLWDDFKRGVISIAEVNPSITYNNILNTSELSNREKQELIGEYVKTPVVSKLMDTAKIFSPLSVPAKIVQSTYKDNYSVGEALSGVNNNASLVEDIVTDPLNLVGVGIANKLSKIDKVTDVIKPLNKVLNIQNQQNYNFVKDLLEESNLTITKNKAIQNLGDRYYQELSKPKNIERLENFETEYGIDLVSAYKQSKERWDKGTNIGKNDRFYLADKNDDYFVNNPNSLAVSTLKDDVPLEKRLEYELGVSPNLSEYSVNKVNYKSEISDYEQLVWHELSHDINKFVIGKSPKLQQELNDIFIYSSKEIGDEYLEHLLKINPNFDKETLILKLGEDLQYITKPTEVWAWASTNLRQELKAKGLIDEYTDLINEETLNKLKSSYNDSPKELDEVYKRIEPFIKDKKKFVELFNKMTLSIAPAVLYLNNQ